MELRGVHGRHARPDPRIQTFAPLAALFLRPSRVDERGAPQLNRRLHDSAKEPGINLRESTTAFPHT
jgi:hypothetical protein